MEFGLNTNSSSNAGVDPKAYLQSMIDKMSTHFDSTGIDHLTGMSSKSARENITFAEDTVDDIDDTSLLDSMRSIALDISRVMDKSASIVASKESTTGYKSNKNSYATKENKQRTKSQTKSAEPVKKAEDKKKITDSESKAVVERLYTNNKQYKERLESRKFIQFQNEARNIKDKPDIDQKSKKMIKNKGGYTPVYKEERIKSELKKKELNLLKLKEEADLKKQKEEEELQEHLAHAKSSRKADVQEFEQYYKKLLNQYVTKQEQNEQIKNEEYQGITFTPKVDPKSNLMCSKRLEESKKIENRLWEAGEAMDKKLKQKQKQNMPSFSPTLTENTKAIIEKGRTKDSPFYKTVHYHKEEMLSAISGISPRYQRDNSSGYTSNTSSQFESWGGARQSNIIKLYEGQRENISESPRRDISPYTTNYDTSGKKSFSFERSMETNRFGTLKRENDDTFAYPQDSTYDTLKDSKCTDHPKTMGNNNLLFGDTSSSLENVRDYLGTIRK